MNRTDIDVPYCIFRMGLATWPQKDRDQGAGFRPTISSNTSRRAIFIISLTRSTGLIAFAASFTVSTVARYSIRRSEEHTSELQSLMRISYAVFCLKKKKNINKKYHI